MLLLALSALVTLSISAAELRVHAAASLSDVLREIGNAWQTQGGAALSLNFGGSSLLARQIEEGAPGDLFFSADEAKLDALDRKGLVVRESRRVILSNALVVIVPMKSRASVKSVADLAAPGIARIALAEPSTVPAGIYARQWLERVGAWSNVAAKVVATENVRGALLAVEGGNVDAGIVYATDARIAKGARVAFMVGGPGAPSISYPITVLAESKSRAEAHRFIAFLEKPEVKTIFVKHGFVVK
ncbi:MAG: molybdate ABC transporter substrate-binding protein [Acidobacteria bacterium]|nr:molybdate ABC transporter substrate-binding protein [Acidobacteriota bacterium]